MENKVNLLFAGKILDPENTLTECKVKNNYCLHAIFKNNIQPAMPSPDQQDANDAEAANEIRKYLFVIYFIIVVILIMM